MADEEKKKQIANIAEAVYDPERTGSKKERAAQLKKTLDHQEELLRVFENGIPVGLETADKKAIVAAAQQAGIDVTEKQEDSAAQNERYLLQLAFKAKMERIKEAKLKAKEDENLTKQAGLHMKGLWMEATNKITNGLLDIRENIAKNTDISNLSGAISQEMSTLSMAFSGLMEAPGMKIIVAGIKYISAWIAKAMWPMIQRFYMMMVKDRIKRKVAQEAGTFHGFFDRMKSFWTLGKLGHEDKIKTLAEGTPKTEAVKDVADKGVKLTKEQASEKLKKDLQALAAKETAEEAEKAAKESKKIPGVLSKIGGLFKTMGEKLLVSTYKLYISVNSFFTGQDAKGMTKAQKAFRKTRIMFQRRLSLFTRGFRDLGKSLLKSAKSKTIGKNGLFTKAAKAFRTAMTAISMAMAGFSAAVMAKVAIVLLIVVGIFFLIRYLMQNWEKVKVKFNMAVDKFKQAFTKVSNWFKDLGEDIVYKIKWVIAKIKDGIASMANKVITKLNKIPGVNIEKWDAGRTEKLEGEREDVLGGRIDRDQKLLGEYKALSVERGKQLEDAAKADAERKADKDAVPEGGNQQVNTSIQTDAREVHMSSESTQPTDFIGMRANMALDG